MVVVFALMCFLWFSLSRQVRHKLEKEAPPIAPSGSGTEDAGSSSAASSPSRHSNSSRRVRSCAAAQVSAAARAPAATAPAATAPTRRHHRTASGGFAGGTAIRAASPAGSDLSAAASSSAASAAASRSSSACSSPGGVRAHARHVPTLQELLSESGSVFGAPVAVADLDVVADDNDTDADGCDDGDPNTDDGGEDRGGENCGGEDADKGTEAAGASQPTTPTRPSREWPESSSTPPRSSFGLSQAPLPTSVAQRWSPQQPNRAPMPRSASLTGSINA